MSDPAIIPVDEAAPPRPFRRHGRVPRKVRDRILIFSQVFVPDPASVGQHVADVAYELAARGYKVRVYTANRGYDDPTRKYPPREMINGVDVVRLPLSSFGKKTLLTRIIGTASFMVQAFVRGLFLPNVAGVIFKACMIDGRPTLKASNSLDKTTLPGCLQVFRGIDAGDDLV